MIDTSIYTERAVSVVVFVRRVVVLEVVGYSFCLIGRDIIRVGDKSAGLKC
jgi:hypothetical protein